MSVTLKLSFGFMASMSMMKLAKEFRNVNQAGECACWIVGVACGSLALYSYAERKRAQRLKDKLFPLNKRKGKTIKPESETSTI